MNMKVNEKTKERKVRYQIQMRPGGTRLIAEFKEGETKVLSRFVDMLLNDGKPEITADKGIQQDNGRNEFAVVLREN